MTLHPIKYKNSLLQDSVSEVKHFSLCSLQVSESSLCLNALLRLKKHTRFPFLRENCFLLEKLFFPFYFGGKKQTLSFLHSHIFIIVHLFFKAFISLLSISYACGKHHSCLLSIPGISYSICFILVRPGCYFPI